jgi:hypothetical protein
MAACLGATTAAGVIPLSTSALPFACLQHPARALRVRIASVRKRCGGGGHSCSQLNCGSGGGAGPYAVALPQRGRRTNSANRQVQLGRLQAARSIEA